MLLLQTPKNAVFLLYLTSDHFVLQYAEGVILNLENMWEESDIRTPMICFLSMGSDPTASIEALAKKQRLGKESVLMVLQ